jgi:hypothetical protein
VGTTAVVWFGFVDPAGANAPTVKTSCVGGQSVLTVEVRDYNGRVTNTVNVLDGQRVLDSQRFGSSYKNSFIRPGNVEHSYRVVVKAGNDRTGDQGFSFDRSVPQQVCAEVPPTTTTTSTQAQRTAPSFRTTAPPTTTTTTSTTVPTTTTTRVTPPPVTTTTTTSSAVTTTTTTVAQRPPAEQPGQGTQPPGQDKPEEPPSTSVTTKFLPPLVPPLVSLIEPPSAETVRTSDGSAPAPTGKSSSSSSTSTSSSSAGDGRGPQGGETSRGTSSSPVSTPRGTTEDNVLVIADDTDLPTTGASIAIPLLFGLCMLTAGGVVVFSMRNPRKRGKHAA